MSKKFSKKMRQKIFNKKTARATFVGGWAVFFSLGIFCFCSNEVFAAAFEGKVYIKGSREPIANANLFLLPHSLKATTNNLGEFRIENVPAGKFQWVINLPGFNRLELNDEAKEQSETRTFFIEKKLAFSYETTITSEERKDSSVRKLNTKIAALAPGAGIDPVRAVQNLPGVNRAPGFSSQVIIQGSAPQDTRYAIDGHEIPIIFHFGGLSSVLVPELTSNIELYTAGYQSKFGRAMGGVLNLESKTLDAEYFKGMAFLDVFNAGTAIETPAKSLGGETAKFAAGARASYIGPVLSAIAKGNEDFNLTVAPTFFDLSMIYQSQLNDRLRFKLLALGSKDRLEFVLPNSAGEDSLLRGSFKNTTGFFRFFPSLEWDLEGNQKARFSFGLGRDFIFTDIGDQYFNLRSTVMTTRGEYERSFSPEWTAFIGYDHRYSWSDVSFQLPLIVGEGGVLNPLSTTQKRAADLTGVESHLMGLYTHHIFKPASDSPWTFYPGLRFDYFASIKDFNVSPRGTVKFAHTPSWNTSLAGGWYAQPPQEQQFSTQFGNPNLNAPGAWHASLKTEKDLSAEWSKGSNVSTGFFGRWFKELVIFDVADRFSNLGAGRAFGWENSIQYNLDPWSFYGAYTLSRSTREDPKRAEYLYQYDQTHFLTAIAAVDLGRNWRISARYRFVTGRLETVPTGAVLDSDNDVYIPIRGALFNERLSAFQQLDLRVDKKWIYNSWTLSFYFDVQNALNIENPEGLSFTYDYASSKAVSGIPVIPTFGLKGEF